MNVDAGIDYRRRSMAQVQAWHTPDDAQARSALGAAFDALAEARDENPNLLIENRELRALRRAGGVVWFDFDTLCGGPRSQNDYLELASLFHTVVLSGVPKMPPSMASEARRFVWLVDVLYDPWPTPLAQAWAEAGGQVIGGLELLVRQAVKQVQLMTGRRPDIARMLAAGEAALRERANS